MDHGTFRKNLDVAIESMCRAYLDLDERNDWVSCSIRLHETYRLALEQSNRAFPHERRTGISKAALKHAIASAVASAYASRAKYDALAETCLIDNRAPVAWVNENGNRVFSLIAVAMWQLVSTSTLQCIEVQTNTAIN